jgi:hypothetical protein
MGLLLQVTRCCSHHTRSSFVLRGPFVTSNSLLSSTHKVVLCLTWAFCYKSLAVVLTTKGRPLLTLAFWYKSLAAVLHTQGCPLFHLGLSVHVIFCCPTHKRSCFVSPGPSGTSHWLLFFTHKAVVCLIWAFWYKSLAAVLHTQGRPLSQQGLLVQVTRCCPPHSRLSFVSPWPFGTNH